MRQEFFNKLFNFDESFVAGDMYESSPIEITSVFDNESEFMSMEYFTVNPIHPRIDLGYKEAQQRAIAKGKDPTKYGELIPRRADINVTSLRNFMFEMDEVDLETQKDILDNCGVPWTTIVFSGSKSYHAILSLKTPLRGEHTKAGIAEYKKVWRRIEAKIQSYCKRELGIEKSVIDASGKNPSRFTRFPYSMRDNGGIQQVYRLGEKLQDLNTFLLTCPQVSDPTFTTKRLDVNVSNEGEFFSIVSEGLKNKLKYPQVWAASAGMYPILFQTTLWAIDESGIDIDVFLEVLEKNTFPILKKAGYPEEKLTKAIYDAYGVHRGQ